jgi:HEAT repeat protein
MTVAVLLGLVSACSIPPFRYIPGIGRKPDASMGAILEEALKDRNPLVRLDAVRLLGQMTETPAAQERAAQALGTALRDEDEVTRVEAVRALGNLSAEIAGPYLKKAMNDESIRVRMQVVQVLRLTHQNTSTQVEQVTGEGQGGN